MWLAIVALAVAVLGILWCASAFRGGRLWRYVQRAIGVGSLEGILFIDGKPAPRGTRVTCCHVTISDDSDGCFEIDQKNTRTRRDGRFHFSFVPAGEVGVGRLFTWGGHRYGEVDRRIEVRAGESTYVELGAGKACVGGRLLAPEGFPTPVDWKRHPPFWLECIGPAPGAEDSEQVIEYSGRWRAVGAGDRPWRQDHLRWRFVPVGPDGAFKVSGLHPGEYVLEMSACVREDGGTEIDWSELRPVIGPMGHRIQRILVPPSGDGEVVIIDAGDVLIPPRLLQEPGSGSITGTLYIDGAPAPEGANVACDVYGECWDFCCGGEPEVAGSFLNFAMQVRTQREGQFHFPSVPEGGAEICYRRDLPEDGEADDDTGEYENEVEVEVLPGQTVVVRLDCQSS